MIDDITHACETCATWDRRATMFRICDTDDVVFNQELLFDTAYSMAYRSFTLLTVAPDSPPHVS
jgi:hypothetical protein